MTHRRNKAVRVGVLGSGLALTIAIPLIISGAQWIGRKAVDTTSSTFASSVALNELQAAIKFRNYADSIDKAIDRREFVAWRASVDSSLRSISACVHHRVKGCE